MGLTLARPRIAIVNSSSFGRVFPEHLARLKALGDIRRATVPPDADPTALWRATPSCSVVVASVRPDYGEEYFRLNRELVLLARHGIGHDNVDVRAATRAGVMVTKVSGPVEREAMAEHTLGLMLAALRRLPEAHAAVAAGGWRRRAEFVGREVGGRNVGLIGFGNIGSRVGAILSRGFGARVLACDPAVSAARMRRLGAVKTPLGAILARCDVISLHASLNPTSRGIIGRDALRRMRRGAVLVNSARGELVDERAVASALRSRRLAAYAADAVAREPALRGHPLAGLPGLLLVPHIGAYTEESLEAMGDAVAEAVGRVLRGRRAPRGLINPEVVRSPALAVRLSLLPRAA